MQTVYSGKMSPFLNLCRQGMVPCEAEMSVLEISAKTRVPSNFWSSSYWLETGSIFFGGLPHPYATKQVFFIKKNVYFKIFLFQEWFIE